MLPPGYQVEPTTTASSSSAQPSDIRKEHSYPRTNLQHSAVPVHRINAIEARSRRASAASVMYQNRGVSFDDQVPMEFRYPATFGPPAQLVNATDQINSTIAAGNEGQRRIWDQTLGWLYKESDIKSPPECPEVDCTCDCTDKTFVHVPDFNCSCCGIARGFCGSCRLPFACCKPRKPQPIAVPELKVVNVPVTKERSKGGCPLTRGLSNCNINIAKCIPKLSCGKQLCQTPPAPKAARPMQKLFPSLFFKKQRRGSTLFGCRTEPVELDAGPCSVAVEDGVGAIVGLTAKTAEAFSDLYSSIFPHAKGTMGRDSFLVNTFKDSEASYLRFPDVEGYESLVLKDKPTQSTGLHALDVLNAALDRHLVGSSPGFNDPTVQYGDTQQTGNPLVDGINQMLDAATPREVANATPEQIPVPQEMELHERLAKAASEWWAGLCHSGAVAPPPPDMRQRIMRQLGCEKGPGPASPGLLDWILPEMFGTDRDYCNHCRKHQTTGVERPLGTLVDCANKTLSVLPGICCVSEEQHVDFSLGDSGLRIARPGQASVIGSEQLVVPQARWA